MVPANVLIIFSFFAVTAQAFSTAEARPLIPTVPRFVMTTAPSIHEQTSSVAKRVDVPLGWIAPSVAALDRYAPRPAEAGPKGTQRPPSRFSQEPLPDPEPTFPFRDPTNPPQADLDPNPITQAPEPVPITTPRPVTPLSTPPGSPVRTSFLDAVGEELTAHGPTFVEHWRMPNFHVRALRRSF
ncbi:hypothetical protein CF319_g1970 [Tilletia indica]|nr:hypothetical protein CF319_g1970 [Tilletia indica]